MTRFALAVVHERFDAKVERLDDLVALGVVGVFVDQVSVGLDNFDVLGGDIVVARDVGGHHIRSSAWGNDGDDRYHQIFGMHKRGVETKQTDVVVDHMVKNVFDFDFFEDDFFVFKFHRDVAGFLLKCDFGLGALAVVTRVNFLKFFYDFFKARLGLVTQNAV